MKRVILTAVAGMFVFGIAFVGVAEDKTTDTKPAVKKQTVCPVMGGKINKNIYVDVKGKRIYLCCRGCISAVKKEPDKYLKKAQADGVVLDEAKKAEMHDMKGKQDTHKKHHH